jgi:hypothetical protein
MKFSRAISRVKWLIGGKTNVSKTISVLVLKGRVWLWLGKTSCPNLYLAQSVYATGLWAGSMTDWARYKFGQNIFPNYNQTSTLRTRTEMVFETLFFFTAQPFDTADSPRELHHNRSPGKQQISSLKMYRGSTYLQNCAFWRQELIC